MTTFTETSHAGEHILSEGNGDISRENITVLSGQNLVAGAVLGIVTASGKYAEYDNAASDGTEVAAGVLFEAVDASAADAPGVANVRNCEVYLAGLTWEAGQDQAAQDAGVADLKALNVIVRD